MSAGVHSYFGLAPLLVFMSRVESVPLCCYGPFKACYACTQSISTQNGADHSTCTTASPHTSFNACYSCTAGYCDKIMRLEEHWVCHSLLKCGFSRAMGVSWTPLVLGCVSLLDLEGQSIVLIHVVSQSVIKSFLTFLNVTGDDFSSLTPDAMRLNWFWKLLKVSVQNSNTEARSV